MDKRIEVFDAISNDDAIVFYSNKEPRRYCIGTTTDTGNVSVKWKEISSNVIEPKETISKKIANIIPRLSQIAIKVPIIVLVISIIGKCFNINNLSNNQLTLLISIVIAVVSLIVYSLICLREFMTAVKSCTYSTKSKHAAEHKAINILEKKQRLPKDLDEMKEITRFHRDCGTEEDKISYEDYAKEILKALSYLLFSFIVLIIGERIEISLLMFLLSIIVIRVLLYALLLKHFTFIISKLFQIATTIKNPEESDLKLVYHLAQEWMKEEYPEYFQEN